MALGEDVFGNADAVANDLYGMATRNLSDGSYDEASLRARIGRKTGTDFSQAPNIDPYREYVRQIEELKEFGRTRPALRDLAPKKQDAKPDFSSYGTPADQVPEEEQAPSGPVPLPTPDPRKADDDMPNVIEAGQSGLTRAGQGFSLTAQTLLGSSQKQRDAAAKYYDRYADLPNLAPEEQEKLKREIRADPDIPATSRVALLLQAKQRQAGAPPISKDEFAGHAPQPLPKETSRAAENLEWSDVIHPSKLLPKLAYQTTKSLGTMAAGAAGAVAGTAAGGPAGGVAGMGLGAGVSSILEEVGPLYQEALVETNGDKDKALDIAMKKAALSGGVTAIGFAAFGIAPFKNFLKDILLQAGAVQPTVAAGGKVAENLSEGRPIGEGVAETVPGSVLGTLIPAAAMHGAMHLARRAATAAGAGAPGAAPPPGTPPPDTDPGPGPGTAPPGIGGTTGARSGTVPPPGMPPPGAGPSATAGPPPREPPPGARTGSGGPADDTAAQTRRRGPLEDTLRTAYGFTSEDLAGMSFTDLRDAIRDRDILARHGFSPADMAKMTPEEFEAHLKAGRDDIDDFVHGHEGNDAFEQPGNASGHTPNVVRETLINHGWLPHDVDMMTPEEMRQHFEQAVRDGASVGPDETAVRPDQGSQEKPAAPVMEFQGSKFENGGSQPLQSETGEVTGPPGSRAPSAEQGQSDAKVGTPKPGVSALDKAAAGLSQLFGDAEPQQVEPHHHQAIEDALKAVHVPGDSVAPNVIAMAAEFHAQGEPPEHAFTRALIHVLEDGGYFTKAEIKDGYHGTAAHFEGGVPAAQTGVPSGAGATAPTEGGRAQPAAAGRPSAGERDAGGRKDVGQSGKAEAAKPAGTEAAGNAEAPGGSKAAGGAQTGRPERPAESHGEHGTATVESHGNGGERNEPAAEHDAGAEAAAGAGPGQVHVGEKPKEFGLWQKLKQSQRLNVNLRDRDLSADVWQVGGGWRWTLLDNKTGEYVGGTREKLAGSEKEAKAAAVADIDAVAKAQGAKSQKLPVKAKTGKSDWTEVGKNSIGQTLYEDQRGVRSYVENGVRVTEPVQIHPSKAGPSFSVDRGAHPEFEVKAAEGAKAEPKPADAELKATEKPTDQDLENAFDEAIAEIKAEEKPERPKNREVADAVKGMSAEKLEDVESAVNAIEAKPHEQAPHDILNNAMPDTGIPDFLLVKNREPLTDEQKAALKQIRRAVAQEKKATQDFNRPKTMTPEAEALAKAMEAEKQAKAAERFERLREMSEAKKRAAQPILKAAKKAAKSGVSSLDSAASGLSQLFGGGKTVGSGPAFDKDTYEKAKPHFYEAAYHFREFLDNANEIVRRLVRALREAYNFSVDAIDRMKPYLVQFAKDVRDGVIKLRDIVAAREKTDAEGRPPREDQKPLDNVPAGEGEGAPGAGDTERIDAGGGETGAGGDRTPQEHRLPGPRGGGGRAKAVRVPHAGAGGGRGGLGAGGSRGKRARISKGPASVEPSEAPSLPASNFHITEDVRLGQGGETEKFHDNLNAIRILQALDLENRRATPEEQNALARYVGWGGLSNAFANRTTGEFKPGWEQRGGELAQLLSPEELRQARESTQNAHYTSKTVVDAMWKAARQLGFDGGLALETSAGTGNFIGLVPRDIAGRTRFIAIEKDGLTARIAKALYPQETVLHAGLEQVPLSDGEAVLNIGNPPFGKVSLPFSSKPELKGMSIHNQFFLAGIDAVRPGGLHIAVVSRYMLDAQDASAREKLATKAKLLGAIRLPDTAFKENARTEVVTDIVLLQRHTPAEESEMRKAFEARREIDADRRKNKTGNPDRQALADKIPSWVDTTEINDPLGGDKIRVNSHFAENPHMVLGSMERSGSMMHGADVTVRLDKSGDLPAMLDKAVARLPKKVLDLDKEVVDASLARHKGMSDSLEIALAGHEPGHTQIDDGKLVNVYMRETPTGGVELAKRALSPETPWSRELYMDDQGRWFKFAPRVDEKGATVKEGRRNVYDRKYFDYNEVPGSMQLGQARLDKLHDIVKLRDLVKNQLVLEARDAPEKDMEGNRRKLAAAYKDYVEKNGLLNDQKNNALLSDMPDGALVQALEFGYRPPVTSAKAARTGNRARPSSATPAPIMKQRVVLKYEAATKAEGPHDALQIALSETGRVDMERIGSLLDISGDEAAMRLQEGDKPLVFYDPEMQTWETRDNYLSGNVRQKLNAAKAEGRIIDQSGETVRPMDKNIKALEAVQPEPWTAENVTPLLGANWIPPQRYADFAKHLVGGDAEVQYSPLTNAYEVLVTNADAGKVLNWRTDAMPFGEILKGLLNSHVPKVTYSDRDGVHVDHEASELVKLKAREIETEFADWVYRDGERRNELVKIFNDKFNTRVTRQHDGSHLQLPGKVPDDVIKMRRHQMNAIWRGIHERFSLLDHVVGAGKTFTAIARIMERRRMGLSRKPMVVVPNHLVQQWASDFYRLYPGAKILAAGKKQFDRQGRRRLFAKIGTGDFDAVIVPHSSFGYIGISPETERRFLEEEIRIAHEAVADAQQAADEEGIGGGWRKPFNVKEAERLATTLATRLDALNNRKHERILSFEQMGIDDLTVDEAHEFKNLFYSSRLVNVRGMGDKHGSQKAFDLYNKTRVLRESPTGSITFLTGTPISNSAVEMYTMMRYLAAKELKELGIEHFDAWRAQSVTASSAYEPTESGSGLREVTRLGREWANMRALMELWYSFTDAVPQEDITKWYAEDNPGKEFPVPKIKGGERQRVVVKPTPVQEGMLEQLVRDFNGLPGIRDPDERNAERLRLMDRARKLSLDARAVDPQSKSEEIGGKLDRMADEAARIHKKWTPDRGTQLVFLDRGVKASKQDASQIKAYDALVNARNAAAAAGNEEAYRRAVEELDKFDPAEIEELRRAQKGGWNAYDQLKANLIKRGIPPEEIRFIQEANSGAEKKAIFDSVNDGSTRILIGSTQKMGAGTNVQERMVGLLHGDVGWKPSDIEQREGRFLRQGNKLVEQYPDFEGEIIAFVTERTIDAKMWALNSDKLKMINGIRKYTGDFNMEFEDADSVGMAEIAALASGDPLLLERVKLGSEIDKLELQERAHRRRTFGIEDAIQRHERALKNYPEQIEAIKATAKDLQGEYEELWSAQASRRVNVEGQPFTGSIAAMEAAEKAIETQKAGDANAKYSVSIDGNRYTNKAGIEEAIHNALGDLQPFEATVNGETMRRRSQIAKVIHGKVAPMVADMPNRTERSVKIGSMLGGDIELAVEKKDKYFQASMALSRGGKTVAARGGPSEEIEKAKDWSIQAARALFDALESDIHNVRKSTGDWLQAKIDEAKSELPTLKEQEGQPFKQATELAEKKARLRAVTEELAARAKEAEKQHGHDAPQEDEAAKLAAELKALREQHLRMQDDGTQYIDRAAKTWNPEFTKIADRIKEIERQITDDKLASVAKRTAYALAPRAKERQRDLEQHIAGLIERLAGKQVGISFDPGANLDIPSGEGWGAYGQDDTAKVTGSYDLTRHWITIALGNSEAANVAIHESWHAIENKLAHEREIEVLKRETPRLAETVKNAFGFSDEEMKGIAGYEIRAKAFELYTKERTHGGAGTSYGFHVMVRAFFERMFQLFRQLGNYLRGMGFQTSEDIYAKAYEGEMAQRPLREGKGIDLKSMESVSHEGGAPETAQSISRPPPRPRKDTIVDTGKAEAAIDRAMDIGTAIMNKVAPMAAGKHEGWRAAAKDYANIAREIDWTLDRNLESLKRNFTPDERREMWDRANEQGEASEAAGRDRVPAGLGLSMLTPKQRAYVDAFMKDADGAWEKARDIGMVEAEGKPFYVPRMGAMMSESGRYSRMGSEGTGGGSSEYGRGFSTKTGSMKQRKYATAAETEAAMKAKFGDAAVIARDISTLPLATAKLKKAIAARLLINKLKAIGNEYGARLTADDEQPGYFTLDHPAFYTWKPRLAKVDGKWEHEHSENGEPLWDRVPIYIHNDFKGPLQAVLGKDTGKIYNGLMMIRSKAMVLVMYSPMIHNIVEFSRAMPAMPGKVLSLQVYFKGNAWRKDGDFMREAIRVGGLVPIGKRFALGQDVSSMMETINQKPGQSWTANVAAYVPGLFDPAAGEKVKATVDKMGDVWHNKLLWDRVADLQAGLYGFMRDGLIAKGHSRQAAVRIAAHLANRYAGALPLEAMSTEARMLSSLILFSRTFTFGNIGVIKDAVKGLPRDVAAQIERDAADEGRGGNDEAKRANGYVRRKSLATIGLDIGIGIVTSALFASAINVLLADETLEDEMKGYVRRFADAMEHSGEHPIDTIMHPINALWSLTPQGEYEPSKRNQPYIRVGTDSNGAATYWRNPFAKLSEDFIGWMSSPFETFKRKEGIFTRPTQEAITNDRGFPGQTKTPVFDTRPNASAIANMARFVWLYLEAAAPADAIKSGLGLAGVGPSAESSPEVNIGKIVGPLAGVTVSKGYPGGPGKGFKRQKGEDRRLEKIFGH